MSRATPTIAEALDGWFVVRAPFSHGFVNEIKVNVPSRSRSWDDVEKCWRVAPAYKKTATDLLIKHYGEYLDLDDVTSRRFDGRWQDRQSTYRDDGPRIGDSRWRYDFEEFLRRGRSSQGYSRASAPSSSPASPRRALFVTDDAPREVVDAAYRALAKLYHPDVTKDDGAKMRVLNDAYGKVKK